MGLTEILSLVQEREKEKKKSALYGREIKAELNRMHSKASDQNTDTYDKKGEDKEQKRLQK